MMPEYVHIGHATSRATVVAFLPRTTLSLTCAAMPYHSAASELGTALPIGRPDGGSAPVAMGKPIADPYIMLFASMGS